MSQQNEMEYTPLHMDEPESSRGGYQGTPYHDHEYERNASKWGQMPPHINSLETINPTFLMQMRLGLIIVSLILWVIVFFGAILVILKVPGNLAIVIYPMLFLGLAIFTVLVALGNFFFFRKK